jgi:predicted RNase H-like HicB family nuclease
MSAEGFDIVVEKEQEDVGYSAYSPTLPGCFRDLVPDEFR